MIGAFFNLCIALILFGTSAASMANTPSEFSSSSHKLPVRVMLIGASIGQAWNLPDLPKRASIANFEFEAVQAWQFDKSDTLSEAMMRPSRKFRPTLGYVRSLLRSAPSPIDLFILKECSSYFPSDLGRNQELVRVWVEQIRAAGKSVMLATAVPVTADRARLDAGKQDDLLRFNDWIRSFARARDVPLLDLEAALRVSDSSRFLRDDLTSGDGSHLNHAAYSILDRLLIATLCQRDKRLVCGGPH